MNRYIVGTLRYPNGDMLNEFFHAYMVEIEGRHWLIFDNYHNSFWEGRKQDIHLRKKDSEVLFEDRKFKWYSEEETTISDNPYKSTIWVFEEVTMKHPFDATGTIGSRPCEVALNKILAEKDDPRITHKIMNLLLQCRNRLKALKLISDERARSYFAELHRKEVTKRIEKITGIRVRGVKLGKGDELASHTACCVTAYFRSFYEEVPSL